MAERELLVVQEIRRGQGVLRFNIVCQPCIDHSKNWINDEGDGDRWISSNGWRFLVCDTPELNYREKRLYLRGSNRGANLVHLVLPAEMWDGLVQAVKEANDSLNEYIFGEEPSLEEVFFAKKDSLPPTSTPE